MRVLILFFLFFLPLLSAVVSLSAEKEPGRQSIITGLGDYLFGTPIKELDLKELGKPFRGSSYGIEGLIFYIRKTTIPAGDDQVEVLLKLQFLNGSLEGILIEFDEDELRTRYEKQLEQLAQLVAELRGGMLGLYDQRLVKSDWFDFTPSHQDGCIGLLELKDETANELSLIWNDFTLMITCQSAKLLQALDQAEEREKSAGKK